MPKRKREDDIEDQIDQIPDQALRIKVARLKARFDHGVTQLTAQLKLARAFDRQKMRRRMKDAESDKVKAERLSAEVKVLGDLKEAKVARNYLLKQCVRTKRIRESQAFSQLFGNDVEAQIKSKPSTAESNVLGRLFKSNVVGEVLPGIMKGVRDVVGADNEIHSKPVQSEATILPEPEASDDSFLGFSDAENGLDDRRLNEIDGEAHDIAANADEYLAQGYDSRLANSSDDDSLGNPGQNHYRMLNDMEITTDEEGQSDIDDASESDEPGEFFASAAKQPKNPTNVKISSLPSLMNGGYYSGSESEDDGHDGYDPDKAYAATAIKERKNRRGQRERRLIAEKKFGQKAKHLVKAKGAEDAHSDRQRMICGGSSRNEGWDTRRGAVDPSRIARERGTKKFQSQYNGTGNAIVSKPAKKDTASHKLHPSWEAARRKKLETGAGTASFAGKKITFD